jgi:hypothetical protein
MQGANWSHSSNDSSEPENGIGQRQNRQDDADDTEETPLPFAHTSLWNRVRNSSTADTATLMNSLYVSPVY